MTLTRDQQIEIEPAIRRFWKSAKIADHFGLPLADVEAWRVDRKRVVKAKRALRRDQRLREATRDMVPLAGPHDQSSVDDGGLLAALKAHMPPLKSFAYRDGGMRVIGWAA